MSNPKEMVIIERTLLQLAIHCAEAIAEIMMDRLDAKTAANALLLAEDLKAALAAEPKEQDHADSFVEDEASRRKRIDQGIVWETSRLSEILPGQVIACQSTKGPTSQEVRRHIYQMVRNARDEAGETDQ